MPRARADAPRERRHASFPWAACAAGVLLVQAALAFWGATRNSVTFDENLHVPAGVAAITRGDPGVSDVNPPLVKLGFGIAALAAGAHGVPAAATPGDSHAEGESFMRANAERYQRVFVAARIVSILLGMALGWLLWWFVSHTWGPAAGLFSLTLASLSPEMLAHSGLATLDVATALGWFAATVAALAWARQGGVKRFVRLAAAAVFLGLTRFSVVLALPMVAGIIVIVCGIERRDRLVPRLAALLLLVPLLLVSWHIAYGGHTSFQPLRTKTFMSERFRDLRAHHPDLRLPLPDVMIRGLDRQTYDAEPGRLTTFVNRRTTTRPLWWWFPFAIGVKWPLGLLAAIGLGAVAAVARGNRDTRVTVLVLVFSAVALLAPAMFLTNLNAGVRYALPVLPLGAAAAGAWLATPRVRRSVRTGIAAALAVATIAESAAAAPWWISAFNPLAGSPLQREFVLNDSNVDWGQGLIALREELDRRGIRTVHLAYHGTTDPAIYGIRSIPYLGGTPGPESEWLAVSSYYFVGLPARMMTAKGSTGIVVLDFRPLWNQWPAARPANCMRLYRVR